MLSRSPKCAPVGRKEADVGGDVDACPLVSIGDDEACEPGGDLHLDHGQPRVADSRLEDRHNLIDLRGIGGEEVEVTGQTVDLAAGDEGCATCKDEARRLTQPGKERSHSKLQRAQHARSGRPCRRNHAAHERRT